MTDSTHQQGPGLLRDVHEGMTVLDADGDDLGTVAEVKMGDAEAATGAGQQMPESNDIVSSFGRAIRPGSGLPEQIAARLIRIGYFRVDRRLARDVYVAADQVQIVDADQVRLNVAADMLATRR